MSTFIETITLHKFKRLKLKAIETITIAFTTKMHLILGTHGSGKSSIFSQLSPQPIDKSDYDEGGYKEITIRSNNEKIVLYSGWDRHEFIVGSRGNINSSQNISTQRKLVKEYFNYDNSIHQLIVTDQLQFTEMSPQQRKDWLMRMSKGNYDYAIEKYNKAKKRIVELRNNINYLQKQLELTKGKRDGLKKYNSEYITGISKEIEVLNTLRKFDYEVVNFTEKEYVEEVRKLSPAIKTLSKRFINYIGKKDKALLESEISVLKSNIRVKDVTLNELYEQRKDALNKIAKCENMEDVDIIKSKIGEVTKNLIKLEVTLPPYLKNNFIVPVLDIYLKELNSCFSKFPVDFVYKRAIHLEYIRQLDECKMKERHFNTEIDTLTRKRAELEDRKKETLTCPKCTHTWHPDYSENDYVTTVNKIATLNHRLEANQTEGQELSRRVDQCDLYITQFNHLKHLTLVRHKYTLIWDHLIQRVLGRNTCEFHLFYGELNKHFNTLQEMSEGEAQLSELKQTLSEQENMSKVSEEHVTRQYETLEHTIQTKLQEREVLHDELNTLLSDLGEYNTLFKKIDVLRKEGQTLQIKRLKAINSEAQKAISTELSRLNKIFSEYQRHHDLYDRYTRTINDLTNQIKELDERRTIVTKMRDKLSPKDGQIAKDLLGFINHFVNTVNDRINSVWSYNMILEAPVFDEETTELNYRFPIVVNNNVEDKVSDIKFGSGAMKEVINLCVKIATIQYLDLGGWPLHIDELGHRMNPEHKRVMYDMVYTLSLQSAYTNLFMISHDSQCYDTLMNTNITYLGDRNELELENNKNNMVNQTTKISYK